MQTQNSHRDGQPDLTGQHVTLRTKPPHERSIPWIELSYAAKI